MKLRKWVVNTLLVIELILFILLASDCENLTAFIISKIVITIVMTLIAYVLEKYSDILD